MSITSPVTPDNRHTVAHLDAESPDEEEVGRDREDDRLERHAMPAVMNPAKVASELKSLTKPRTTTR